MLFIVSANVNWIYNYWLRQVNVIFTSIGYNGLAMRSVPKGIAYRFCCA